MWQSHVEIEDFPVTYFNCKYFIAFVKGEADTRFC